MKRVTVQYFAVLRERRGLASETVETSAPTVGVLVGELVSRHRLGLPPSLIRAAVDREFVDDDCPLAGGETEVLVPPVAGG